MTRSFLWPHNASMKTILALALLFLVSCGSDDEPPTKGEYCDALASARCNRAVACAATSSFNACFTEFKLPCCASSRTCDARTNASAAEVYRKLNMCTVALSSQACAEVEEATLPAICVSSS